MSTIHALVAVTCAGRLFKAKSSGPTTMPPPSPKRPAPTPAAKEMSGYHIVVDGSHTKSPGKGWWPSLSSNRFFLRAAIAGKAEIQMISGINTIATP